MIIYDRARKALSVQLGLLKPAPSDTVKEAHLAVLETSIKEVEDEYLSVEEIKPRHSSRTSANNIDPDNNDLAEALRQRVAAYQFSAASGTVVAVPAGSAQQSELASDLLRELLQKAMFARERLGQGPDFLRGSFDRLQTYLAGGLEGIRPGPLLSRLRTFQSCVAAANSGEVLPDGAAAISDFSSSLEDFASLFPEIAAIESARIAQRILEGHLDKAFAGTLQLADIARESPQVDSSAIAALTDALPDVAETEKIISLSNDESVNAAALESRAKLIAQHILSVRNFAAAVIVAAQREVAAYGKEALPRLRKGSLAGIEEGTKGLVKGGVVALALHLGGVVAAIAVGVASFGPFTKKLTELEAQSEGRRAASVVNVTGDHDP